VNNMFCRNKVPEYKYNQTELVKWNVETQLIEEAWRSYDAS